MKYLIETAPLDDNLQISVFANGKHYAAKIPNRGDDVSVLIEGLVSIVSSLREIANAEHDKKCKGVF